ncbi:MAG: PAM68 family protein [Prochloraceae cyanobacterium]
MSSEPSRDRLPFEPQQKKKKTPKTAPVEGQNSKKSSTSKLRSSAIPDAVSKRMIRRMALFSGIPTALGVSSFFVSYLIVTNQWFKLPTTAVVLVSMGCFGLGVVGLSYGVLSTSWDENRVGTWWGGQEFGLNLKRMTTGLRAAKKESGAKE